MISNTVNKSVALVMAILVLSCLGSTGVAAAEGKEILYWVAPMDPNYQRDKPGKSPMGMDLVPVYADQDSGARDVVSIDPVVVQNLGVRTAGVERGPVAVEQVLAEESGNAGGGGQVLVELALPERVIEARRIGDERAATLAGHDDSFTLELQIGPLDRDDADLNLSRKCPN